MSDESHWEDLQRVWQEPPNALPRLEKLLKKRTPVIWALTGIDAVASLLVVAGVIWVMRNDPTPFEIGLSVFVSIVLVLGWAGVLLIRRGTWRADVAAPAAMVELSIRRCRASIRLALLNKYGIVLGLVLGVVFRDSLRGISIPDLGFEVTILMRIGAIVFLGCWIGVSELYKRRKRAELTRLEALKKELKARSNPPP